MKFTRYEKEVLMQGLCHLILYDDLFQYSDKDIAEIKDLYVDHFEFSLFLEILDEECKEKNISYNKDEHVVLNLLKKVGRL